MPEQPAETPTDAVSPAEPEPTPDTIGAAVRALVSLDRAGLLGAAVDERTLDERIAAVQLELEDVPRRGHAEVQTRSGSNYSYDYILEADLMKAIRPLLAKHGVAVYYSDRILDSLADGLTRVEVTIRFRAHGEEITISGEGHGADLGDKAANKAKTSAVRYLLWKMFLQPSDEDPEQENVARDSAAAAAAGRQASRTPARPTARKRADSRGTIIQGIARLAVELDEIQGQPPGRTLGELPDKIATAFGAREQGYPNGYTDAELVEVGQQLGLHVTSEREDAAKDGYTPTAFTIDTGGDA